MASIHRDARSPRGVWYCTYNLADGRRAHRSTGKRNKADAAIVCQAWDAAEKEAARGELSTSRVAEILSETLKRLGQSPLERLSAQSWLNDWLASKAGQVSPATFTSYGQAIAEFLQYLGPKGAARRLEAITEADIEGFVKLLRADGRSASTINKLVRKFLSAPFEKARRTGKIRYNPVAGTSPEKAQSISKHTFSSGQITALLGVASPDWQGLILFGYTSGARLGDAARLKWSSLDVANGIVVFREQKTGAKAVLGLHPDFLDWLSERQTPEKSDAFVFPSLAAKELKGQYGLSHTFVELIEAAGIENPLLRVRNAGKGRSVHALSFHSLRHTAASSVFNQAALREITRRVSNHAASGVVDRYIHQDLEAIREATKLIPRLPKYG